MLVLSGEGVGKISRWLPQQFPGGDGLLYGDDTEALLRYVEVAKRIRNPGTRAMVATFTWRAVLQSTILCEDEEGT